jgi:hypothetical protein
MKIIKCTHLQEPYNWLLTIFGKPVQKKVICNTIKIITKAPAWG